MATVLERIGVESAQEYGLGFVDLRTLMMGTDWGDEKSMGELSIAGHARAMLEWHNQSKHCGRCGTATKSLEAGQRRQCTNEKCKHKCYPRTDPAVIMLVIDKEKDRALLGRQSRFVPRLWSCLAGFIEPGESLEEAVRRETREEAGIDVGEVVYHSSQPWPLGTSSMSCQLMIGFFAFAKSFSIHVDKKELEDAQWHSRESIREALAQMNYKKVQEDSALKIRQRCLGKDAEGSLARSGTTEATKLFVPGPYAIAHHLIATWAAKGSAFLSRI